MRGGGRREAIDCLKAIQSSSVLSISAITQMELMVGCRNKLELQQLDRFLRQFHVITIHEAIVDTATELLRDYRLSHGLLIADSLIAATALTLVLPFISKNQRDYRFISGLQLLPYPVLEP